MNKLEQDQETESDEATHSVTVIIPVYDDTQYLEDVARRSLSSCSGDNIRCHLLIIDDGSSHWPDTLDDRLTQLGHVTVRHSSPNKGKGAVLAKALPAIETEWTVIIDADNEYDPADIPTLLAPLAEDKGDWIMGSRYGFNRARPQQYRATYFANRLFNAWFLIWSGVRLQDLLTGLYAFRTELVSELYLQEPRFAYTPELLWKTLRRHHPRWTEVPVGYRFRTYGEGKKIHWWETFTILAAIVKYKFATLEPSGGEL